jgi:hypothetical protein
MFHREKAGRLIVTTFPYSLWFYLTGLRTAYRDYNQTFSFRKREGNMAPLFFKFLSPGGYCPRQGETDDRAGFRYFFWVHIFFRKIAPGFIIPYRI